MVGPLIAILWLTAAGARYADVPQQKVGCAGSRALYQMNLGIVREAGEKPHMRSLVSVAAIANASAVKQIEGWLGIDDAGHPWIEFSSSGSSLRKALGANVVPFPGSIFSPLKTNAFSAPAGFVLISCYAAEIDAS
jgi:hypothetical protein